jgi:hypothetical protein
MPSTFVTTRDALHRVAELVVSPARVAATGNEIALAATPGGFGTPPFPDGGLVRVEGTELVSRSAAGQERRTALTTIGAAAAFAGVALPAGAGEAADAPLAIDRAAAARLADFYAFVWNVLEALRGEAAQPSELHLWPEHFDIAFEDREVTYGGSPGDASHAEPYLYVSPWTAPQPGPLWNATGFAGAEAAWREGDPAAALAFFREHRDAL